MILDLELAAVCNKKTISLNIFSKLFLVCQAWRKRWLVIEFPTSDNDEKRSSSILVRVYVSHHHENKGPPAFCIPILDVHALHRIQSR